MFARKVKNAIQSQSGTAEKAKKVGEKLDLLTEKLEKITLQMRKSCGEQESCEAVPYRQVKK